MKKIGKDNHGFSMVELIIVLAIIVVVGGTLYIGFSSVSGKPAQSFAKKTEALLNLERTTAMGKNYTLFQIEKKSDGYYAYEYLDDDPFPHDLGLIGESDVNLSTDGGTTVSTLEVWFERSDGSLKRWDLNGITMSGKIILIFERAGHEYTLTVDSVTGRVSVK